MTLLLSAMEGYSQAYNFSIYSVNEGLPHAQIADVIEASDGFLWIATSGAGVSRFDGNEFTTYDMNQGLRDDYVNIIYEDSKKRIWAGTYYGGLSYLEGNQFVNPFEDHEIDDYYITTIKESLDGKLWIGTFESGIYIYDDESLINLSEEDGLVNNAVWHFHWESSGQVYISTHNGLSIYDGLTFTNYGVEDGISGSKVFKTAVDQEGRKWFATSSGITTFENERFTIVNEINGRPLRYIYDLHIASNGDIWIGTENDGLFRFNEGEYYHITKREGLSSNYIHRIIEDSNGKIWNTPTKNRNTTYTNLSPGSYRFDVQARSGQGPWSEASFYDFSVEKPFWMKIWFWSLMLFLIVLGFTGAFRSYAKRLERERLSSLVDERTAHLLQAVKDKEILVKEIHHRVKNNLAMIIGLLELQATRSTDEATITTLKDSILRIYSMSLVHEKLYSTDHLTNVDVKNYISDLIDVISLSMNLDHQNITIEKNINSFTLSLDQGITCGLLINELVTNAIKHAFTGLDEGTICIEFEVTEKENILTISDNGNGFPDDFPGFENLHELEDTSLGLTLITTLTKQMNGTLTNIPQERGTKIRIIF